MRTIGLIGGMSAESTRLYYDAINAGVRERLGGLHSARIVIYSVDFAPIAAMQAADRWDDAASELADAARALERAGADCVALATNTMHRVADDIARAVAIPFLHIADATTDALVADGRTQPFLIATRFTMEQEFYKGHLARRGLSVSIPGRDARDTVHRVIYDELCRGVIDAGSRAVFEQLTARAADAGADSVILGCTEVGMLLGAHNAALPVYDTTTIHADAMVAFALDGARPAGKTA